MTVEILTVVAIHGVGMAICLATGSRELRFLVPAGFLVGLAVYITAGAAQAMLLLQVWPIVSVSMAVTLAVALLLLRRHAARASISSKLAGQLVCVLACVGLAAAALHTLSWINFHVDSHEYMAIGSMLTAGTFGDGVSLFQIEKRMLAVPLMHAPANLAGGYYLASVTPLLALATVGVLSWFVHRGLTATETLPRRLVLALAVAAPLFLLTMNRFVQHSAYINGHLLFGALLLVIVGSAWVSAVDGQQDLLLVQLAVIPALIVTRPEAGIVAAVAVGAAALASEQRPWGRVALVWTVGTSVVVWNLFLLHLVRRYDGDITTAMLGMMALGAVMLASSPLLAWPPLMARRRAILVSGEVVVWLGTVAAAVRDPQVLAKSLRATAANTLGGVGGWGWQLAFLALLALLALAVGRSWHRLVVRVPLTSAVPLLVLLIYLSDGGYRVGAADSLNRMLIQYVPLALLFVAVSVSGSARSVPVKGEPLPAAPQR